jgi:hypothetical protein
MRKTKLMSFILTFVFPLAIVSGLNSQMEDMAMSDQVFSRTVKVDGLTIFYREAGPKNAPPILLLGTATLRSLHGNDRSWLWWFPVYSTSRSAGN